MAQYSFWFRDKSFGERDASPSWLSRPADRRGYGRLPASPLAWRGLALASRPALSSGGLVRTLTSPAFDHELLATGERAGVQVIAFGGDAFAPPPIMRAIDAGRPAGHMYDVGTVEVTCSAGVAWAAQLKELLQETCRKTMLVDV